MARQAVDTTIVADRQWSWADWLPAWLRPYGVLARWDRPIGSWLLLWPCWWGMALACGPGPTRGCSSLFAIGAVSMRGAGCYQRPVRSRPRCQGRAHPQPAAPSGRLSVAQALVSWRSSWLVGRWSCSASTASLSASACAVMRARAGLSPDEADHLVAPGLCWASPSTGARWSAGAGVTGGLAAPAVALYAGRLLLDARLRHDLRATRTRIDDALVGD